MDAQALLASNGLLVRPVGFYGLAQHLHITIGPEEHNRAVVHVLKALMGA